MAGKYTYEDFRKAATDSGLLEQFSDADLKLAELNPDAGMSILSYKQDYAAATTDEARALANYGANQIRSSYGEYTGGKDGSQFYSEPMTPGSFSYEEAPTFNYDLESDEVWQNYKKQYTREGKRATEDVLGQAAAMTGGIPSTAAITAAGQAGDYYNAQMTDKVADLYEAAYNRHLGELQQYNADRSFAYGQHLDEINDQTLKRQEELENALLGGEYGDYSGLNDMGINTEQAERDRELELAMIAAQYGDYSYLEKLGIQPQMGGTGGGGANATDSGNGYDAGLYQNLVVAAPFEDRAEIGRTVMTLIEKGAKPEKINEAMQKMLDEYLQGESK